MNRCLVWCVAALLAGSVHVSSAQRPDPTRPRIDVVSDSAALRSATLESMLIVLRGVRVDSAQATCAMWMYPTELPASMFDALRATRPGVVRGVDCPKTYAHGGRPHALSDPPFPTAPPGRLDPLLIYMTGVQIIGTDAFGIAITTASANVSSSYHCLAKRQPNAAAWSATCVYAGGAIGH